MYTIIVNTPGPQGPTGPSGSQGPSGSIDTSSLATTGSNTFVGNQIVTGSIDITGSLTVNTVNVGANTINFIDENQNILTSLSYSGSNLILSSGSIALSTGSLIGTASYANEALTASYALNTSITIDTSSLATTGSNTFNGNQNIIGDVTTTGSLIITNGISGSFSGSGENLYNIPSTAIVGLNLSQISSGSYSASISDNKLLVNTSVEAPYFIGDGSQLTGIFLEKRHDFTGSYSYCGTAPSGSSESANVWDINRITIYPAGNTLIQSASLVSWTDRYNNIYN